MKTRYYTATTVNGFIADANHSVAWLMQFPDLESQKDDYPTFIAGVGALVMGSHTYEWLLRHEQMVEHPEKWPYAVPAWVVTSRRLPAIPGVDVRFAGGDVREIHAAAAEAAGGKDVWVVGGGDLAGQFLDHGLLDEIILTVAPVLLATGQPLLPRDVVTPPLTLTKVVQHGDIYVSLTYAVQRPTGRS